MLAHSKVHVQVLGQVMFYLDQRFIILLKLDLDLNCEPTFC